MKEEDSIKNKIIEITYRFKDNNNDEEKNVKILLIKYIRKIILLI